MLASTSTDRPSLVHLAPPWIWGLAVFLIGVPLAELVFGGLQPGTALAGFLFAGRLFIEGGAIYWAAGGPRLPQQVRRALLVVCFSSVFAGLLNLAEGIGASSGLFYPSPAVRSVVVAMSYVLGLGQLLLPMAPLRRGEWRVFGLDLLIGIGGICAVMWVLVTRPLTATAPSAEPAAMVLAYAVAQVALVGAMHVLVVRGLGVPSRRAVWLFIAGEAAYVPVVLLAQYFEAGLITSPTPIDAIYFGSVVLTLLSAVAFRYDEVRPGPPERLLAAFSTVNPFVLAAPLTAIGALSVAIEQSARAQVRTLVQVLATLAFLLVVRTLVSALDQARLLEAEAGEAARVQVAKSAAIGRLAGGVAHEFNNLLQVVIGHADLAAMDAEPASPVQADLARIREAGERAAMLTRQLLHFSGQQFGDRRPVDLAAAIRQLTTIQRTLGPRVLLELAMTPVPLAVVDRFQIEQLVLELAANARDAMPNGGRFRVEVREDVLREPLSTPILGVPAGRYVVIDASDTGPGIATADVARVFEPFYTTKLASKGPGLGLAAVYGIVAAHAGGIMVETEPGQGTRFHVYLPAMTAS